MSAMALRPPRLSSSTRVRQPVTALEYEIAQEQASALGRLGRRLEAALQALADFDAAHGSADNPALRAALLDAASHALWQFVVQREACGLRDSARVMRDYRVPADVQARMGASLSVSR